MFSVNEQIAEAIRRHSVALLRYEAGERKTILKMLQRLFGDVATQLRESGLDGSKGGSYPKRWLNTLFRDVEKIVSGHYDSVTETMQGALAGLAKTEAQWAANSLNKILKGDAVLLPPVISSQLAAAASEVLIQGAASHEWWGRQSEKFLSGFKDQMRMGWLQGESNDQLLKRLVGGKDVNGNIVFNLAKGTKRGAESLIRTSVQAIASDARMRVYRENDDIVKGVVWVATLDGRTTVECASFDGLAWDLDGNPIGHDKVFTPPPLHWGCRSTITPYLMSFKELGIKKKEIPESTRASMDGQVPEKIGFEGWLNKKDREDPNFVNDQFGTGRAKLWRAGKISLLDMTDQQGRELTLTELQKH